MASLFSSMSFWDSPNRTLLRNPADSHKSNNVSPPPKGKAISDNRPLPLVTGDDLSRDDLEFLSDNKIIPSQKDKDVPGGHPLQSDKGADPKPDDFELSVGDESIYSPFLRLKQMMGSFIIGGVVLLFAQRLFKRTSFRQLQDNWHILAPIASVLLVIARSCRLEFGLSKVGLLWNYKFERCWFGLEVKSNISGSAFVPMNLLGAPKPGNGKPKAK